MSIKAILILSTIGWGAFTFLFYRGLYTQHVRHKDYAAFAKAAFSAVAEHFAELKEKSVSLVVDKGFNIKDDTAWQEALETFITNIVAPNLDADTRHRIRTIPSVSKNFSTFIYHFVSHLVAKPEMPQGYDLKSAIDAIEDRGNFVAFLSASYRFMPGKEVATRLAMVLVAISMFTLAEDSYAGNGEAFTPLAACNALIDEEGFQPNASGYTELDEESYSCATPYKELGAGALPNNLAMYGRGTKEEVTRVKIMLNVNVKSRAAADTKTLATLCGKMVAELSGSTPKDFTGKVAQGVPFEAAFDGYRLFLTKSVWKTGKGFELNCGIATLDHKE
jgi:hypothetical protein